MLKNYIRILFLVLLLFSASFFVFLTVVRPITVKLYCQRRGQIMNDVIKTAIVDAAYKSEPVEDKNIAKLLNGMYEKCIRSFR
jgi:membrane protein required for beta-lactamase induction